MKDMNTWTAADHPRGDGGRFKTKIHTEPEGGLGTEPASTPKTFRDGWVEWRTPDGKRHRVDGPAVIHSNGHLEWWQDGNRHCVDGPAVIWAGGRQDWWVDGKRHRVDGPAYTEPDGYEVWYLHGQLHRTDGPAIVRPDGTEEWWQHGTVHRSDGPAIIHPDGTLEWWENHERKPPELEAALTMVWLARTPQEA